MINSLWCRAEAQRRQNAVLPPDCLLRPDAQDEEHLSSILCTSAKMETKEQKDHGWWATVLLAALRLCPASWAVPPLDDASFESRLPKELRPLRPHEPLDVPRLSRLLCKVCMAQASQAHVAHGSRADAHFCLDGLGGSGRRILSVPSLLGTLACPEAAGRARKEVHGFAAEAIRTSLFLDRPLQLHHLALLEWAGAEWHQPDNWGRNSLHSLCAGTYLRAFAGGGDGSAPLRSSLQGARARYLAGRVPNWETTEDLHGLTALNYLLPPLQPSCACAGTAQWEIFQSLVGRFVNTLENAEVVSPLARGVMSPTALNWVSSALHSEGDSLQAVAVALGENAEGEPASFSFANKCLQTMVLTSYGCAFSECRLNLLQARAVARAALVPLAQLHLLRATAASRSWSRRSCEGMCCEARLAHHGQLLEDSLTKWADRKSSYEKRLVLLEMELGRTTALPPPVTSSGTSVKPNKAVPHASLLLQEDQQTSSQLSGRARARAFLDCMRQRRLAEASDASLGVLQASAQKTQAALGAAVDRLAQDLYELEAHFVFELVQNADDNKYSEDVQPELSMLLETDDSGSYFMTRNNERGLRESDVLAMCDINASSKTSACIGKKGIGWKSTFAVSQCPHVLSGDFTFKFDVGGPLGKLAYVTPTWLTDAELETLPKAVRDAHQSGGTVVYLPLRTGCGSIVEAFDRLCQHHVTLLFLKQLRRIQLGYPSGKGVCLERLGDVELEQSVQVSRSSSEEAEGEEGEEGEAESVQVFRYMVHPFEVEADPSSHALVLRLAFPSTVDESLPHMSVHVGLPVRCVGFHFAIDAPFDLVASRGDLHEGSPVNQILCQAIPRAFADFLAGPGNGLSGHAMRFVGSEAAPRHVWQHVRSKLLESLVQVACIRTEQGAVAKPTDCLERPHHPLRMAASQLIPAKLLQLSCGRSFASSSAVATVGTGVLEVFSLKHWVKVLKYRGSSWPKGLVAVQLEDLEDPCDFFVPFGTWLDMELREAEQPSSFLAQIWELDLLPAFRSCTPTLRICDGPIFSRPCVKIRADWQGFLSEAGLLKFVEPRVRLALQNATPHLMESLTMGMPSRPELAALCISWHLTAFNGLGVTTEPMAVKAVLASLACLKETFLTDELPEGSRLAIDLPLPLPKQDPEARQAWWRELGKWLWLPSWHTVSNASTPSLRLLRPKKLRSSSYLGLFGADWKSAEPEVVQDIFAQRVWGEDILGWEAFLDAIGVREFRPAESGHGGHGELARRLGASLGSQDWWTGVLKRGLRVQAYVSRRCQRVDNSDARWLRTLPVTVEVDAPKAGHGNHGSKDRKVLLTIRLQDLFLHDVYGRIGGQYLQYVRLPGSPGAAGQTSEDKLVCSCLQNLGVQVHLSAEGLLRSLRLLRDEGRCHNIEVYADIYKEVTSEFGAGQLLSVDLREAFSELVFVPFGTFRHLEACTWEEDADIQWLTEVPALEAHYLRYGPSVQRYFLEVLGMPRNHPGFSPGPLLTALRNLVKHVEDALSSPTPSENLRQTPTTARGLLESLEDLASKVYASLAKACRKSSVTWHADVRRAFAQERLLVLPPLELPDMASAQPPLQRGENALNARGRGNGRERQQARTARGSSSSLPLPDASRRSRPKRLFTKESWWEVEDELKETKATNLNLRSLYGDIQDAEFLFLRVIGVRRSASRSDVVQRLRESMSEQTHLVSNWTEGIDISDLEELENIQTSSYFRPADWRAPGEEDDADDHRGATPAEPASFRPPTTTGSAHPPAWRSSEAARDAEDRANAALRADAARRQAEAAAKARAAATQSRGQSEHEKPRRFSWQRSREAHSEQHTTPAQSGPGEPGEPGEPSEPGEPFAAQAPSAPNIDSTTSPEPKAKPMTWSRMRAKQASHEQKAPQPEATPGDGRAAAPKMRGTRASAWASFRSAESLQAQESQDVPQHAGNSECPEDAGALQLRLAALRAAATRRKTEVEELRKECRSVEETTERYVRILQDFQRSM